MRTTDWPIVDLSNSYFVRVAEVSYCHWGLEAGDFILRNGDRAIKKVSDLYGMTQETLSLSVIRARTEIQVEVPTITMSSRSVTRIVWFCRAQLEMPFSPIHFGA